MYQRFVSLSIQFRKNYQHAKLDDITLLALLCWQVELGMTNQRRFYRFLLSLGFKGLPERSRFNRVSVNALETLQWVRFGLVHTVIPNPRYTIVDSFPMPLCHPIRNHRAKRLRSIANIGFNSTKIQWYYGLKGSFEVTNQGIAVAYTITRASIHDVNMVATLVDQYPCRQILADAGYLSRKLKAQLAKEGINFWAPKRRNMHRTGIDDHLLKRDWRQVGSIFSRWVSLFNPEKNRAHSAEGFQTRLEQCLLVDTINQIN
ncbi:IS982 family transposase [Levilactobacillus sp. 244-2]|uniref:IS982 family transposase n=1 Tax=Levilactobacillus sp. 244-2 TaxID=2799569 RepID=UPI00194FB094|nr:IS982 family transposase [Levilactobacillus sp. 244-2]